MHTDMIVFIAYSSSKVVAAGTDEGHMLSLNGETGAHLSTVKVGGAGLNCLAFNKSGDVVALGSSNGSIYLYTTSNGGKSYKKQGKMVGGVELLHLDWSTAGNLLQTVNKDLELVFWDVKSNKMERHGAAHRDEDWLEQTCTVSFAAAGAWANVDYKNYDAEITSCHAGSNRGLEVVGDDDGYVRLFRYPCTSRSAAFDADKMSSGAVRIVRFLYDDIFVVAAAAGSTLVRWKLK
jgi:microtubule-associated protein-like 1/2